MKLNNQYRIMEIAGQYLMLFTGNKAVDANAAFSLSESTAWLLKKAGEQDFSEADLVEWLCAEYEVGEDEASEDVKGLIELLRKHDMVLD